MKSGLAEIIAHRGASFDALENTLAAFRLGLDQGADALECDVHVSADNQLVVIHDPDLKRLYEIDQPVKEATLAELKILDARIPSLAEVLDLIPAGKRIFIEVKCGMSALEPLKELFEQSPLAMSQIVLMEFDLETVIAMKSEFPEAEVLWLRDFHPMHFPWRKRRAIKQIFETARQHGLDGVNLQNISQLNARVIRACHQHNLSCRCWTVDDPVRAAALIRKGIDGITTNKPDGIRKQLNQSNPRSW